MISYNMIGVEDSLIYNMYHNCEHTPQNDEVEDTNIVEKLILEFCGIQNIQPLVRHGNVVRLAVVGDHQEHKIGFVERENHHANRIYCNHYERLFTASKKHDTGQYDPKNLSRIHQWPDDLKWNPEEWNLHVLLWH